MGNGASFHSDNDPSEPASDTSPIEILTVDGPGKMQMTRMSLARPPSLKAIRGESMANSLPSFKRLRTRRTSLRRLLMDGDDEEGPSPTTADEIISPLDFSPDSSASIARRTSAEARSRRLSSSSLHRIWRESIDCASDNRQSTHLRFQPKNSFAAMSYRMLLANSGRFGGMFDAAKTEDGNLIVLGKGMEGEVFRVKKKGSGGRQYALKTVHLRSSGEAERAFELRHLARLSHPNIVRLHEAFKHNSKTYLLSFELGQGGDLLSRLQKDGAMEESRTAYVLAQILSALQYLHFHNVIHRDIKLENFVFRWPDHDEVILVDFGLAKLTDTQTVHTSEVGTIHYLSPEVIKHSYSFPADLWSLGVVAYMMLTAKRPFRGTTDEQIMQRIISCDVSYPDNLWGHLSVEARNFVQSLLIEDQFKRPTAEEARQDRWIRETARTLYLPLMDRASTNDPSSSLSSHSTSDENVSRASSNSEVLEMSIEDVVVRMRAFVELTEFKRYALRQLAREASDEVLSEIMALFRYVVARTPGVVTYERLRDVIPDDLIDDDDLDNVFDVIDDDTKGYFTWNDFCAVLYDPDWENARVKSDLRTVFRRFSFADSTEGISDVISSSSLYCVFRDTHTKVEADEMLAEVQAELGIQNAYLTEADFVEHMIHYPK